MMNERGKKFEIGQKVVLKDKYKTKFMFGLDKEFIGGISPKMIELYEKNGYLTIAVCDKYCFRAEEDKHNVTRWSWDNNWFEAKKVEPCFEEKQINKIQKELEDLKCLINFKKNIKVAPKVKPSFDITIDSDGTTEVIIDGKTGVSKLNKEVDTFDKGIGLVLATARACGISERKVQNIVDVLYEDTFKIEDIPTDVLMEELKKRIK